MGSKIAMGLVYLTVLVLSIPSMGQTSIEADPILYGASPDSTDTNGSLFIIDPITGEMTNVGDFGVPMTGLTYNADKDILYGVDGGGFAGATGNLFQIDRMTGVATPIGPLGSTTFFHIPPNYVVEHAIVH